MTKCVFCGREESPSRGVHLITNDGNVNFLCSSKCRKNAYKLHRDKKKLKWTEAFKVAQERVSAQKVFADKKAEENAGAAKKK